VADCEAAIRRRGIPCHDAALRFLAEFEGITVRTPRGPFSFSLPQVLAHIADAEVPYLTSITGEPLCPVGWGVFLLMLVAPRGEAVLLDDDWRRYARFGTPSAAVEAIFEPDPGRPIWVELGEEHWPPGYR
jgi:hypothetical protein